MRTRLTIMAVVLAAATGVVGTVELWSHSAGLAPLAAVGILPSSVPDRLWIRCSIRRLAIRS